MAAAGSLCMRFPSMAELANVCLNQGLDLLRIDLAGTIVINLPGIYGVLGSEPEPGLNVCSTYLRHSPTQNVLVVLLGNVLLCVVRL